MAKFREHGFKPEELKLYWSAQQVEDLSPKGDASPPHDPSDADAIDHLRQYPVEQRNHAGVITYVHSGIEKAVFQVPEGAQIILLNFAVTLRFCFHLGIDPLYVGLYRTSDHLVAAICDVRVSRVLQNGSQ